MLWLVAQQGVQAHDARPLTVTIEETSPLLYAVRLRAPPTVEPDNQPLLQLPVGCTVPGSGELPVQVRPGRPALVRCDLSLEAALLPVRWPLYNPSLTSVLQFAPRDRSNRVAVFAPDKSALIVPAAPDASRVIGTYLLDGIRHIWNGIDHLLFITGLLLIAGTTRRILLGISGFTLAHSLTLSLAALGVVSPPVAPTEAAIALSIVFLARELLRDSKDTLAWRHPAWVATLFGLLHGFGFAAALQEGGLPPDHVAMALLGFNLGVETGQLAFIAGVLFLARYACRLLPPRLPSSMGIATVGGYIIGVPAMFWLLQRLDWLFKG